MRPRFHSFGVSGICLLAFVSLGIMTEAGFPGKSGFRHEPPPQPFNFPSQASGSPSHKSLVDTLVVYGKPGTLEGTFEDAGGNPDWQGWTGYDRSSHGNPNYWHPSTTNSQAPSNHMVYCGVEAGEPGYASSPGYGNNWIERLDFFWDVDDPSQPTNVFVSSQIVYWLEEFYDYLHVQLVKSGGPENLAAYTGAQTLTTLSWSGNYNPGDYVIDPHTGNEAILFRFLVKTDGTYSDEDGLWPSDFGAAQLDEIRVWIDGTEESHATFEPVGAGGNPDTRPGAMPDHDSGGWLRPAPLNCGDFSKLVTNFPDIDPAADNLSPQVAFIDDGTPPANDSAARSTGGTYNDVGYGYPADMPGTFWGVNNSGGVGALDYFPLRIQNEVQSPVIQWNDPSTTEDDFFLTAFIRVDVWAHLPLATSGRALYYYWKIRHTTDGTVWSDWVNANQIHFGDLAVYRTDLIDVHKFLPQDTDQIQIALGVLDIALFAGPDTPPVSTAAPLFDNVKVLKGFDSSVTHNAVVGSNVTVYLDDLQVTFQTVGMAGATTLYTSLLVPQSPVGFQLATSPPLVYDVQTAAVVGGDIRLCFSYDESRLDVPEEDLVLLHWDTALAEPDWVDITAAVDTAANKVCGITDHLSPFVLAAPNAVSSIRPRGLKAALLAEPVPNPLNPRTELSFVMNEAGRVDLAIYDLRGRLVKSLIRGEKLVAGPHARIWNGRDEGGREVSSGAYLVSLSVDGRIVTPVRKVTVIR